MKSTKMSAILVLALGLTVLPASVAEGAQYLTVNGADVTSITLELGQSRAVEIRSTDSMSYVAYVGFDDGVILGNFSHLETKPEAGNLATVIEYNQPDFYGYYVSATGINPPPAAGVHFVFQYDALQPGETVLKLYDSTFTSVIDSIHITVTPLQPIALGTAFTYQGRLMDANKPADGLYDFKFKLYDNPDTIFAMQQGSTIDINNLDVIDGYFTVELDFAGDVFDGDSRWLDIGVRPGDSNDPNAFVTLSTRQELTPVPYALQTRGIFVDNAGNVGIGTTRPAVKLEVAGTMKADSFVGDGTQLAGVQRQHSGAIYRWAVFSTYGQSIGWYANNDEAMFGGVRPSVWSDGNGMASQMSSDKEVLRTLFTRKGYGGKNAVVAADEWYSYSSSNSKHGAALFRIRNSTKNTINWPVSVYMTCYSGWGERASIALNGGNIWNSAGSSRFAMTPPVSVNLPVPPNRTSTAIFVAGSSPASQTRSLYLAFTDNRLELPAGLEFVDDLDTATGGWDE